jgi:3',5'-cyclic AMP phosphodiesterase CpdA
MLGDNIYEKGDVNTLGKAYFTDTYAPLIKEGVHFIVALGNHDRLGGFQADQLKFFQMPGYYYEVHKPYVDFFVLETNIYAGDKVQQQWLANALSKSHTPWKIVMGHQPIYSSGWEGGSKNFEATLQPLLERYHVQLYLAGHDHDYERMKPINGVQYIVSGGGGAYLRKKQNNLPQSVLFIRKHHFLSFEMTPQALSMDVIDAQGEKIDHLDIANPQFSRTHANQ